MRSPGAVDIRFTSAVKCDGEDLRPWQWPASRWPCGFNRSMQHTSMGHWKSGPWVVWSASPTTPLQAGLDACRTRGDPIRSSAARTCSFCYQPRGPMVADRAIWRTRLTSSPGSAHGAQRHVSSSGIGHSPRWWRASFDCSGRQSRLRVGLSTCMRSTRTIRCRTRLSIGASTSRPVVRLKESCRNTYGVLEPCVDRANTH